MHTLEQVALKETGVAVHAPAEIPQHAVARLAVGHDLCRMLEHRVVFTVEGGKHTNRSS